RPHQLHFHEPGSSVRGPRLQPRQRLSTTDSAIRFSSKAGPLEIDSTAGRALSTGTISERIFSSLLTLRFVPESPPGRITDDAGNMTLTHNHAGDFVEP